MQTTIATNARRIRKTVRVRYARPVRDSVRRLMILPPTQRRGQRVMSCRWQSFPPPDFTRETSDEWGNSVLELRHEKLPREWNFALQVDVSTETSLQVLADNEAHLGAWCLPSALCPLTATIRHLAAPSASTCGALERATQLNQVAHQALKYRIGCTDAASSAQDALNLGAGVCQDFAHLMIALCRASALPARYVSGYGVQNGRMHAWVEVWDGQNWHAFDPTEGTFLDARAVAVAHGRDYRDVMPHSGQFRGAGEAKFWAYCSVQVLAEGDAKDSPSRFENLEK